MAAEVSAPPEYTYYVSVDIGQDGKMYKQQTFTDAADAMAMWSAAISEGRSEYILIEAALRERT
jgi:hypothetical protein